MFRKNEHGGILNELGDRLREVGLQVAVEEHATDLVVRISRASGAARRYAVVVQRSVPAELATALHPHPSLPTLVVAGSITEEAARLLRERGVDYVDEAGNAHIAWDNVLIDVRGRRRASGNTTRSSARGIKAFSRAGLQVGFVLLTWPSTAAAPLRGLARASGVSLGTAQAVVDDLTKAGYLHDVAGERRLGRAGELLDRWSEAYSTRLSPALPLGDFQVPDLSWWRDSEDELTRSNAQVGGEAGASLLDRHLVSSTLTLYVDEQPRSLIGRHRMVRAEQVGNVHVRRRFWTMEGQSWIVPSTLIYADLLASGDPRQREHADRIRTNDDRLAGLDRL
ncbi:type IV toxin-antitoxin system AbiEi family antitoxin [Umezawaea endophytica]|uniref:Type IV toxin-antitoxin system AbiEi family antitoxin n=1 Tax=Umezawaea endophytica TaxID=1654476 RepID=A0A9X2VJ39_9PSEU|nr:type IV toxin-antitoxin system AbiEi family antitoxin [Umezawaea endophytica]MCS7476048.1 type IV toxin-antitoxin system AbiEi family antitoxin [Umezawaea endophytica]